MMDNLWLLTGLWVAAFSVALGFEMGQWAWREVPRWVLKWLIAGIVVVIGFGVLCDIRAPYIMDRPKKEAKK